MIIAKNTKATISFSISIAGTEKVIKKGDNNNPETFGIGLNQLLPEFEKKLLGLKKGDKFDFIIKAEDAYGPVDPYAIFDIPKDTFEVDGKTDEKMLQLGNVIPMTDNEGNKHFGKIIKVFDKVVTMDFNHQLAGKDLHFSGTIVDVENN